MNPKFFRATLTLLCLLAFGLTVSAQDKVGKPETLSLIPKMVISKIRIGEGDAFDVRGKVSFTFTAANSDDSLVGTMVYTVPEDARQKIASMTGKPVAQVPASVTVKDLLINFQKATACPVIHFEFSAMDIDITGVKSHFNRFVLDLNDDLKGLSDAQQGMVKIFCKFADQINAGRQRRGLIKRINDIINGEDPELSQPKDK